jgi:c-di-GMP phosphodiesterase
MISILPNNKFVFEILETTILDENIIGKIKNLKAEGYVFALDDFNFEDSSFRHFIKIFDLIQYIKVDLKLTLKEQVINKINDFKPYPVSFLAEKVENLDEFEFYKKLGFKLFQGYFFSRPTIVRGKILDPTVIAVMNMINLIFKDPDINELEWAFKKFPELTINLLKYINSAAIASRSKIESIKQAIALLGHKQLLSWLLLMVYARPRENQNTSPLLFNAVERAKLMELFIKRTLRFSNRVLLDEAFLTGLLSLLDALFQTPMEEILDDLNISTEIKDAILKHQNLLGQVLLLIKKSEDNQVNEVAALLNGIKLTMNDYTEVKLESLCWTQDNIRKFCV